MILLTIGAAGTALLVFAMCAAAGEADRQSADIYAREMERRLNEIEESPEYIPPSERVNRVAEMLNEASPEDYQCKPPQSLGSVSSSLAYKFITNMDIRSN